HFCPNWTDRFALIGFNDAAATATNAATNTFLLESGTQAITPDETANITLYHYLHHEDQLDSDCLAVIRQRNSLDDLHTDIAWWQHWFDAVAPSYSVDRIPSGRGRDVVEGSLTILKMNGCRDGGMVANERGWNMSYIRDAYCGLRGLEAFGHFDEVKQFMQWL